MVRLGSTPVLDFGSFSVKAGFAGESYPLLVFTQEQFHPKTWPIVRGKIEDWQLFEQVRTSFDYFIIVTLIMNKFCVVSSNMKSKACILFLKLLQL